MPYQPIGKYEGSRGFARKTDFKRPVTFYDRVRFVGDDSTMEIFGGVLSGDLNADNITLGTLSVDRIAANTITADRLVIGMDNLIANSGFEDNTLNPHVVVDSSTGAWAISNNPRSGARSLRYFFGSSMSVDARVALNGLRANRAAHPAAVEGDEFYFTAWVRDAGPPNGTTFVHISIFFYDEGGSSLSFTQSSDVDASAYERLEVSATAPAGTAYVVFEVAVDNASAATTGAVHFDDCYARRMVGGVIIEDGTITADKLTVTSLDAITANMGTLTVNETLTVLSGGEMVTSASTPYMSISSSGYQNAITFFTADSNEILRGFLQTSEVGVITKIHLSSPSFETTSGVIMSGSLDMGYVSSTKTAYANLYADGQSTANATMLLAANTDSGDAAVTIRSNSDSGANAINFQIEFVTKAQVDGGGINVVAGSASAPSYAFIPDLDTGTYSAGTNALGITTGGVARWTFRSDGNIESGSGTTGAIFIRANIAGSAGFPTYTFEGDTNTGIYRRAANNLGICTGGSDRLILSDTQFVAPRVYLDSVAGSANVIVSSNGRIRRATSARKYKRDIVYDTAFLADYVLKPVTFTSKQDNILHIGFIAEDFAEQDTRMGVWDDEFHDELESFDTNALLAVMAAKINRLEARLDRQEKI